MTPDFDKLADELVGRQAFPGGLIHDAATVAGVREFKDEIRAALTDAWNQALAAADKSAEAWLTGANGPAEVDAFRAALRAKKL